MPLQTAFNVSSGASRWFFGISVVALLVQAISLYQRGSRGDSDISVFHRATQLLQNGIGGELYTMRDAKTDWPIPIPPAGLAFFQPLAALTPAASTLIWAIFNIALAGLTVFFLYKYCALLDKKRHIHLRIFPSIAAVFLLLACGSLQVGQYSILFMACCMLGAYAYIQQRFMWAGLCFALPAAIKIYPVLLFVAPLALVKELSTLGKVLLSFVAGFLISSFFLPTLFYGSRTLNLSASWWQNIIFSRESRMAEMQNLGSVNNQSLDGFLLRYLTHDEKFHERHAHIPHFALEAEMVILIAHFLRLAILLIAVAVTLNWRRRGFEASPYALLMMISLWAATLYLMLPETRARYAVYAFPAFIPLLVSAYLATGRQSLSLLRNGIVAICFILTLSLIPQSLRVYGVGLFGPLLLWCENIRLLHKDSTSRISSVDKVAG